MPYPNGMNAYRPGSKVSGGLSNPANDNATATLNDLSDLLSEIAKHRAARKALEATKFALRLHPAVRGLLWGWDMYSIWNEARFASQAHAGFSLVCASTCGAVTAQRWSNFGTPATPCCATTLYDNPATPFPSPLEDQYTLLGKRPPPTLNGAWVLANYRRNVGYTGPASPYPQWIAMPKADIWWSTQTPGWGKRAAEKKQAWDPWELPIGTPGWEVPALPYPLIPLRPHPWSDPSPLPPTRPRPTPDPTPTPDPWPNPDPRPLPRPLPRPRPRPDPRPETRLGPRIRNRPRDRLDPRLHIQALSYGPQSQKPPGKNKAETKFRGNKKIIGWVWGIANGLTETKDVVECMYRALPKRFKIYDRKGRKLKNGLTSHAPPISKQFKQVYKFIASGENRRTRNELSGLYDSTELADWGNKFLDCSIANQIEDYVFGKLGKAVGAASRYQGRPIGYGSGPAL